MILKFDKFHYIDSYSYLGCDQITNYFNSSIKNELGNNEVIRFFFS